MLDYYPFGMPMPNRNVEGNYRYGYQGQYAEKEPELGSGINSFELRLWDSRIGRWLSPDPYGQFASPYLGMGNNPIRNVDPDGGFTCDTPPCPESALGTEARFNFLSGVWDDFSGHTLPAVVVFGGQGSDLASGVVALTASRSVAAISTRAVLSSSVITLPLLFTGDSSPSHVKQWKREQFELEGKFFKSHLFAEAGQDVVARILERNNSSGYYLHYTSIESAYSIAVSRTILPNSSNSVYLTNALMAPAEAFQILFQAQERHLGRGNAVIIMRLHNYQEAGLRSSGDIFEFIHEGTLKPANLIYAGPNPFGERGSN